MPQRVIRNFETLATNASRLDALSLAEAGFAALDTGTAIVEELRLDGDTLTIGNTTRSLAGRRIFFIGIGKCAVAAAHTIESLFGERLTAGIALDVSHDGESRLKKVKAYIGTHPLPSEVNERATAHIVELLSTCREDDLVLVLVSGGGSTLLCLHKAPMTCTEESALFTGLSSRGASIQDINTVRKHISLVRGGGLAKIAYPAEIISLIISDVPGNALEYIASGPTVRDTTTVADAQAVLARYKLTPAAAGELLETTKEQKYFERVTNILLLTNHDALLAMQRVAAERGYTATIMSTALAGEARDIGHTIVETLHTLPSKTVLLYAGESTVTISGPAGAGGRNQEMALAALAVLHDDELLLPFSSDGRDNTNHAGAIADATTLTHARAHNLSIEDALVEHRSYDFFTTCGDALVTGYTGSNVSDLIIAIKR